MISHLSYNALSTLWLLSVDSQRQRSTEALTAPGKLSFPAHGMLSRITAASALKNPHLGQPRVFPVRGSDSSAQGRGFDAKKNPTDITHCLFKFLGTKSATGI